MAEDDVLNFLRLVCPQCGRHNLMGVTTCSNCKVALPTDLRPLLSSTATLNPPDKPGAGYLVAGWGLLLSGTVVAFMAGPRAVTFVPAAIATFGIHILNERRKKLQQHAQWFLKYGSEPVTWDPPAARTRVPQDLPR